MSEKAEKHGIALFFSDNYRKLVRFFRVNYSDLSEMEAEDIVSDLMTDLLEKAHILERVESIFAYIYQSPRNKASYYPRRRKKTVAFEESLPEETDYSTGNAMQEWTYDMTAEFEASEIRDRLVHSLAALESNQRAVWTATEPEGYSFRALSEEGAVPVGTLLARKHWANAAWQKELRDFKNK